MGDGLVALPDGLGGAIPCLHEAALQLGDPRLGLHQTCSGLALVALDVTDQSLAVLFQAGEPCIGRRQRCGRLPRDGFGLRTRALRLHEGGLRFVERRAEIFDRRTIGVRCDRRLQLVRRRLEGLRGGSKGLGLRCRAIAVCLGAPQLPLECPDQLVGLFRIACRGVHELLSKGRDLTLGSHRPVQELLCATVRLLRGSRGFRGPRGVLGPCLGFDRASGRFTKLHLERPDAIDGLVLLFAELLAELRDLVVASPDQSTDLLVVHPATVRTREAHALTLAEPTRSLHRERDDGHEEGDSCESPGNGLHESPRLTGGFHDRRVRLHQLDGRHGLAVGSTEPERRVDVEESAVAGRLDPRRLPVVGGRTDRAIVPALSSGLLPGRGEDQRSIRGPDADRARAIVEDPRLDDLLEGVGCLLRHRLADVRCSQFRGELLLDGGGRELARSLHTVLEPRGLQVPSARGEGSGQHGDTDPHDRPADGELLVGRHHSSSGERLEGPFPVQHPFLRQGRTPT